MKNNRISGVFFSSTRTLIDGLFLINIKMNIINYLYDKKTCQVLFNRKVNIPIKKSSSFFFFLCNTSSSSYYCFFFHQHFFFYIHRLYKVCSLIFSFSYSFSHTTLFFFFRYWILFSIQNKWSPHHFIFVVFYYSLSLFNLYLFTKSMYLMIM